MDRIYLNAWARQAAAEAARKTYTFLELPQNVRCEAALNCKTYNDQWGTNYSPMDWTWEADLKNNDLVRGYLL